MRRVIDPSPRPHYYPPTLENITQANDDVTYLRVTNDPEVVSRIALAVGESVRLQNVYHPDEPNPYEEIYDRCRDLRAEALVRIGATAIH